MFSDHRKFRPEVQTVSTALLMRVARQVLSTGTHGGTRIKVRNLRARFHTARRNGGWSLEVILQGTCEGEILFARTTNGGGWAGIFIGPYPTEGEALHAIDQVCASLVGEAAEATRAAEVAERMGRVDVAVARRPADWDVERNDDGSFVALIAPNGDQWTLVPDVWGAVFHCNGGQSMSAPWTSEAYAPVPAPPPTPTLSDLRARFSRA
jgi:hypothetical protein